MRIVADENIPYVREAFGGLGEVITLPGRSLDRASLIEAELLLVRSVTKVNAALLDGTAVRFVATATIGEDHIDRAYLKEHGIGFSSAPGCNANSVADYVSVALLELAQAHGLDLSTMSAGVIGVGNVGKRVAGRLRALGLHVVLNDPPLAEATCEPAYRSLDEALACDIVTLHVPLEKGGLYPTWHLVNAGFLAKLRPGAILFNTARGPVIDTPALHAALDAKRLCAVVLDVWEGEPQPDVTLVPRVDFATPHIAGYSFDGKVNGTRQIYEAACAHLGIEAGWDPTPLLPAPEMPELVVDPAQPDALLQAVRAVYPLREDDVRFRALLDQPAEAQAAYFDRLRKDYPRRREFKCTRVSLRTPDAALARTLSGLGFQMEGVA
jgi:erythronate-4-phosphate dehydrogenase